LADGGGLPLRWTVVLRAARITKKISIVEGDDQPIATLGISTRIFRRSISLRHHRVLRRVGKADDATGLVDHAGTRDLSAW